MRYALLTVVFVHPATFGCSSEEALQPLAYLATFNTGTHPLMDSLGTSPYREICDVWYGNDLCTIGSEELVEQKIAAERPDILMLQEIWDQDMCDNSDRPAESAEPPFVCSIEKGHQLARVLPRGYDYACAAGEPNSRDAFSCIAYRRAVFRPEPWEDAGAKCQGRDCSALMKKLETECDSKWGRVAALSGQTVHGPAILVAVHLLGGVDEQDLACQAEQVRVMGETLGGLREKRLLIVAGDFNLDLDEFSTPAVDEMEKLQSDLDLCRLPNESDTNQLFRFQFDMIFTRGWEGESGANCQVDFVNPERGPPMIDHGWVGCR